MPPITSGLVLWLDADDAATLAVVGGSVTAWEDKASSAVFSVPTGGIAPTQNTTYFQRPSVDFGLGTQPVVLRTGTPITFTRPITVFQTLYWPSASSTYAALSLQDGVASNAIQGAAAASSTFVYRSTQGSGGIQASAPPAYAYAANQSTVATGAWHTIVYQTPTAMSGAVIRYDGAAVAIATAGTAPASGQFDTIGSSDGLYYANGAFAEILVYDGALSTAEIESVEAYLYAKWSSAGGGTDVDVDVTGVSAAGDLGSVGLTADASVSASGVDTVGAVGPAAVAAAANILVSGAYAQVDVSQVLVWSAVDDTQSTIWTPVNDAQSGVWTIAVPGAVQALAGTDAFSYTPDAVVWRPVNQ